ncbi:F-box protein CPR1-like [Cornus florida]|uniref:F-box protein CPR1-like n=1 Tax=Cornus florida TaxID=4283 RepID=UPI0028977C01|nr:F-box protein CPR1-like [Cornus florida]
MFSKYAELDFPLKKNKIDHYFRLIGSCNGLICHSNDQFGYHLFLWNPSIRKMMILPPVCVTFQSHASHICSVGFGFGFDSITGDYKVVRMVHFDQFNKPPEIHIFNLGTGTWRNISHVALPHIIINERAPQAFVKGAAHWIASESRSYGRGGFLIVSFHMGDEKFGQIMLLPHANHLNHFLMQSALYFRVAKLQESLALIHITGSRDNTCCIWGMEEYGVAESWTKLFSIDMTGFNSVVGFTREGQILVATRDGYLVAYELRTGLI